MQMLMILAASFLIFQTHWVTLGAFERASPQETARASDEMDHYRAFLYLADLYMKTHAPASEPLDLSAQDLLPSLGQVHGMGANAFPSNWHVVVQSNSNWATCTPLSEEALGLIAQSIKSSNTQKKMVLQTSDRGTAWVIAQDASAADLCN